MFRQPNAGYETGEEAQATGSGTSIFDPVLAELAYRWFCPPTGVVLDPFAGGSVRGIVAAALGRHYVGVDLRPEQIEANEQQWRDVSPRLMAGSPPPRWICGDSQDIGTLAADVAADFVFSCPPYAHLEVYSDDPKDLSTMAATGVAGGEGGGCARGLGAEPWRGTAHRRPREVRARREDAPAVPVMPRVRRQGVAVRLQASARRRGLLERRRIGHCPLASRSPFSSDAR